MNKIEKFTDREWEDLASLLSDEMNGNTSLLGRFMAEDSHNTINQWKELGQMNDDREINVDKAWNNLYSRLIEEDLIPEKRVEKRSITRTLLFRIAAIVILLTGLGSVLVFLKNKGVFSQNNIVTTADNQKNLQVTLPDGSYVFLNRNTRLSYNEDYGKKGRHVTLSGEAFFEIMPDEKNPFTIDAGKASIKVIGTSFNVITDNAESAVEVFVKTGKVMVSDDKGDRNMILDPGYIGKISSEVSERQMNEDQNYMAWNTGVLIFDDQTLEEVFQNLKKVYNMEITTDDPKLLENRWTTNGPLDNQPEETIIRIICASFNLRYTKDGNIYHLAEK